MITCSISFHILVPRLPCITAVPRFDQSFCNIRADNAIVLAHLSHMLRVWFFFVTLHTHTQAFYQVPSILRLYYFYPNSFPPISVTRVFNQILTQMEKVLWKSSPYCCLFFAMILLCLSFKP